MSDEEIKTRNIRLKQRASTKRDVAASHIRHLHASATAAVKDLTLMSQVTTAVHDLDNWWSQYSVENDALLDVMIELDEVGIFSPEADAAVYALVIEIKTIVNNYERETSKVPDAQISDSAITKNVSEDHQSVAQTSNSALLPKTTPVVETQSPSCASDAPYSDASFQSQASMRLPEIPLPKFDGDLRSWLDFRDRFVELVIRNKHINSDITRFYYLLGCLQADAGEALKEIPVTKDTFQLAWNTLVKSYDKPRKLASSIIESLLTAPASTLESLLSLKQFLNVFDEGLDILESLHVPDLCSFLLFTIASKSLPIHTRRLFESENTWEFPSFVSVLEFVKDRVRVLDNAGGASALVRSAGGNDKKGNPGQGKYHSRPSTGQTALVSSMKSQKPKLTSPERCRCCGLVHAL